MYAFDYTNTTGHITPCMIDMIETKLMESVSSKLNCNFKGFCNIITDTIEDIAKGLGIEIENESSIDDAIGSARTYIENNTVCKARISIIRDHSSLCNSIIAAHELGHVLSYINTGSGKHSSHHASELYANIEAVCVVSKIAKSFNFDSEFRYWTSAMISAIYANIIYEAKAKGINIGVNDYIKEFMTCFAQYVNSTSTSNTQQKKAIDEYFDEYFKSLKSFAEAVNA